jgi:hypothetical protein
MATLCLTWAWAAASIGAADQYKVYLDEGFYEETPTEKSRICVDQVGEHFVHVVGVYNDGTESLASNAGSYVYFPPKPVVNAVCSDFDNNGVTGFSDFSQFTRLFGKCNDLAGSAAKCGSPRPSDPIMAKLCVPWLWTAATTGASPDYYNVYLDEDPYETTPIEWAEVCTDTSGWHFVHVEGVNANEEAGPQSEPGEHFYFGLKPIKSACVDFDDDGVVDFGDWGIWARLFGSFNYEGQEQCNPKFARHPKCL